MVFARKRNKELAQAKLLQARGDIDGAVQQYLEANAPLDAAAVLARAARYAQAGKLLLDALSRPAEEVGALGGEQRKMARMAASYLARGGDVQTAVTLFVALGERPRAIELLERAGDLLAAQRLRDGGSFRRSALPQQEPPAAPSTGDDSGARTRAQALERAGKLDLAAQIYMQLQLHGDAGRVLARLGQPDAAAEMFEKAQMPYEAAACYLRAGNSERGLGQLVRVSKTDARYRKAAAHAIHLAGEQQRLSFQVEHFLGAFLATGPQHDGERRCFIDLADLYVREGMLENARDAIRRVLAGFPGDGEAQAKLTQIETQSIKGSDIYRQIGEQDSAFRAEAARPAQAQAEELLPGLPALPALPALADTPAPSAAGTPRGKQATTGPLPAPAAQRYDQATKPDGAAGFAIIPPLTGSTGPVRPESLASPPGPAAGGPSAPEVAPAAARAGMTELEPDPFAIGGLIDRRYRLESQLGIGGSAIVYRAFDLELDETIALKVFLTEIPDPELQAQSLARFKQELKLNRKLVHPNILRLFDIGMYRGRRYISMELLVGRCLDEIVEQTALPVQRAIAYLVQTCRGLQAAHQHNVIHRDIKPQNIFITEDDVVKVMDFGIAKQAGTANLTKTGMMAGTPRYMSPEQINNFSAVGPAADLYSLGIVAYQMLTAAVPFDHDELMPLLMMHVNEPPRPMRDIRPDLPEDLDQLVLQLLAKDPSRRPASCGELARTLQRISARL